MMRWHAVYTQPQLELWARTNLWERGLAVYLPQYKRRVRHARQVREVAKPLFSRYLFVQADLEDVGRRAIASAKGVVGLVAFGDHVPAVPDAVIAAIKEREGIDGMIRLGTPGLKPGERVRVMQGALADHVGLFDGASDAQRVVVLLNILGRQTRVRVSADVVARCA
ncbi:MAG: transcriptional activator RfaH [Alphaproteobacteria bacterium]|nr:transcriptional activator RfaH [Alphaproteobacteria bacterium]